MAMGNSVQNLQKGILGSSIIANIPSPLCDIRKEISFWAVFHDDIGVLRGIHDSEKGNDIGVLRDLIVEAHLSLLKQLLPSIERETIGHELVQGLHSIVNPSGDIFGQMDDAIGAGAQDLLEL
jgi:hypothetical protein